MSKVFYDSVAFNQGLTIGDPDVILNNLFFAIIIKYYEDAKTKRKAYDLCILRDYFLTFYVSRNRIDGTSTASPATGTAVLERTGPAFTRKCRTTSTG